MAEFEMAELEVGTIGVGIKGWSKAEQRMEIRNCFLRQIF